MTQAPRPDAADDSVVPLDAMITAIRSALPARIYYLTASGKDLWCRRPYTFVFSTSRAAERFATDLGTELELIPIAVSTNDLVSEEGLASLRAMSVTRIFVDPTVDPGSGDVHGTIVRIEAPPENVA